MNMKTAYKVFSVLALVAGLASCNKAEFVTADIVTFDSVRASVKEDAGTVKIPVSLVSNKTLSTTVTYTILPTSTAKEGVDYTMKNKSGVLTITNEKGAPSDSIEITAIPYVGELQGNKTLDLEITSVTEDGIHLGATTKCTLTIIDIDGGINLLLGTWSGKDLKTSKNDASIDFVIELVDEPDEYYPDANIKITGLLAVDAMGNDWSAQVDIFAFFDDNNNEIHIYPYQAFDAGNFGGDLGILYVSFDTKNTILGTEEDVILAVNEGVLTFTQDTYFSLNGEDGEPTGYTCGCINSDEEIRKQ